MIKMLLIPAVLLLSACATSTPSSEPSPADSHSEVVQTDTSPEPAHTDAQPEATPTATTPEPDLQKDKTELAAVDPDIEEVLVEGFKEKEVCTREVRTGTRIPTKYCRTVTVDLQGREASRALINRIKRSPQALGAGQKEGPG